MVFHHFNQWKDCWRRHIQAMINQLIDHEFIPSSWRRITWNFFHPGQRSQENHSIQCHVLYGHFDCNFSVSSSIPSSTITSTGIIWHFDWRVVWTWKVTLHHMVYGHLGSTLGVHSASHLWQAACTPGTQSVINTCLGNENWSRQASRVVSHCTLSHAPSATTFLQTKHHFPCFKLQFHCIPSHFQYLCCVN